jgi:hypothetical protein
VTTTDPTPNSIEVDKGFDFLDLDQLLELIDGANGVACRQMYADYKELMDTAPGAASNHQVWEGGYRDHIAQTMNLFRMQFADMEKHGWLDILPESEQFSLSDGLTVLYLHDLEKPFKYKVAEDGSLIDNPDLADKKTRKEFRKALIDQYGIRLNDTQQNALLHAEGVRDEYYRQGERVDQPLAALVHACDLISARVLYDIHGNGQL